MFSSSECSNIHAGNQLTTTVSTAAVNSSGALQYQGGAPTLGSSTTGPFQTQVGYLDVNYQPVTNQLSSSRTETYSYDDLNRLSNVNYGDGESQTYSFDSMGNRLGKTDTVTPQTGSPTTTTAACTYDADNRLTGVSQNGGTATAVTSDADGNTLTDASGRSYTWDSQNRMASCTYSGTTTTFTYGADGLRRSLTVNGVTTDYAYDGTMLVQEFQTNAQTGQLAATATYMPGPSGPICRINESNQTEGYYPAGVTSFAPLGRGVTHWYVYDGLGSKIAELDDNNNMTSSGLFDVYGLPRVGTQQGVAASSSQGYVGSLGHVTDQSTGGLIYMQARYYDPSLGRFASEDPGRNGTNWFVYTADDPVNRVDGNGKVATYWNMFYYDASMAGGLSLLIWAYKISETNTALAGILMTLAVAAFANALTFDTQLDGDQNRGIAFIAATTGMGSLMAANLAFGSVAKCNASIEAVTPIAGLQAAMLATAVYGAVCMGAEASIGVDS